MNLRILKKLSKRAMPLLLALSDTDNQQFLSEGDGEVGLRMERKHTERMRVPEPWGEYTCVRARRPGIRPWIAFTWSHAWAGTPMVGGRHGWEEPEWEERTAWEHLLNHVANMRVTDGVDDEGDPTLVWGPRLRNATHVLREAAKLIAARDREHREGRPA